MAASDGALVLEALAAACARAGLHVIRAVGQATLDRAGVDLRLGELAPGAVAAVVLGDGGGDFFARFRAAPEATDGAPDPINRYTARVVRALVAEVAVGLTARFPFDVPPAGPAEPRPPAGSAEPLPAARPAGPSGPLLPLQRIGMAAGLPPGGPLGLQIHPRFGPWWAYRALVLCDRPLPEAQPLASSCTGCPAPCVSACPGGAVAPGGFAVGRCGAHRLVHAPCADNCSARRACVVGREHAYGDAQLGFFMAASLRTLRAWSTATASAATSSPGARDPSGARPR